MDIFEGLHFRGLESEYAYSMCDGQKCVFKYVLCVWNSIHIMYTLHVCYSTLFCVAPIMNNTCCKTFCICKCSIRVYNFNAYYIAHIRSYRLYRI